jgi:multiple sugar transport system permease protein
MTGGGPQQQTEVILTYMYHQAFQFIDFGYGSALAFTLTLVVLAISLAQMRLYRRKAVGVARWS